MSAFELPASPANLTGPVRAWSEPVIIPTYRPLPPDKNPMFLENRVYQGSSGKVYPLPFIDRIEEKPVDQSWQAIHIENEFIRVMILPQLGGRIHVALDKTNGYDFIYRQNVIKPAMVGLAGPWISGGIEFNWPQHHRPSTFMPADAKIEEHSDGSRTVWLSDHEPMNRMKGMHGVCLHPGKAFIELKARLYNRTPLTQTFLWWANVATRVHEKYQSFFPRDVQFIADHAKRAVSRFPLCDDRYYGVDYGRRAREGVPQNEAPRQFVPPPGLYSPADLSWYANIPVPTSYMATRSDEDFFGGYDHAAAAGIVYIANHHISPGKKQWTWGNQEFGYAWDRNLTDPDEKGICHPYIELMAGVYTDNQPDFSFLSPGETKIFSQYWYPIQQIGPADLANLDAAVHLSVKENTVEIGICVTRNVNGGSIILSVGDRELAKWNAGLRAGQPFTRAQSLPAGVKESDLLLIACDAEGVALIRYSAARPEAGQAPAPATQPPPPSEIASNDELYITGLHLEQYRHATRAPELYWQEALRRDPGDSRCNNAVGLWHLRRGEFKLAEKCFRRAIERLTRRNPNPSDGEPYYNLGIALNYQQRHEEAYAAFYKSAWNAAWRSAAYHAIAELDCRRADWFAAIAHLDLSLQFNSQNLRARNLKAIALSKLGRKSEADEIIRQTLALDPLDWWARHLFGEELACDAQVRLDLAIDYMRAGLRAEATRLLPFSCEDRRSARSARGARPPTDGAATLAAYYRAYLDPTPKNFKAAAAAPPDYCFPARLEEIAILQSAIAHNPGDARALYYLGNLYYDGRRREEAIELWKQSAQIDPAFPTAWRNLGLGLFNVHRDRNGARAAYDRATQADPTDARLLYERDQLRKRLGDPPLARLADLCNHLDLIAQRDDFSIELCTLYNQIGRHEQALEILSSRNFQPWEGGEGMATAQHVRAHLAIGRRCLSDGEARQALGHFESALRIPPNLAEARHPLANLSDIHYWLGRAAQAAGDETIARRYFTAAAEFQGDFVEMSVRSFSEMTYYTILSLQQLGYADRARKMSHDLLEYARSLAKTPAKADYFATSLPAMLLFHDDLDARQKVQADFLEAQALLAMGEDQKAAELLAKVLRDDPNHAQAADLLAYFTAPSGSTVHPYSSFKTPASPA